MRFPHLIQRMSVLIVGIATYKYFETRMRQKNTSDDTSSGDQLVSQKDFKDTETSLLKMDLKSESGTSDRLRKMAETHRQTLLEHKQAGNSLAIWRDGRVVIVPPE